MKLRATLASIAIAWSAVPARAAGTLHGPAAVDALWTLVTAACVVLTGAVLFGALRVTLGVRRRGDVAASRNGGRRP